MRSGRFTSILALLLLGPVFSATGSVAQADEALPSDSFDRRGESRTDTDPISLYGADHEGWLSLSLDECARSCLADDRCGLFLYSDSGRCRLHRSSAVGTLQTEPGYDAYVESAWGSVARQIFKTETDPNKCFGWPLNRTTEPFAVPFDPSEHLYAFTDPKGCDAEAGGPGCVSPAGTSDYSRQCRRCTMEPEDVAEDLPACPTPYGVSIRAGNPDRPMVERIPVFHDTVGIMAAIIMIPVFFVWLERKTKWKVFDFLPAIIWIFLTPVFLSNLGVIPRSCPTYSVFKSLAVPMFIVLMLLDINIREALKVAWRGAAVLVIGSLGIVVGAAVSFFLFKSHLAEDSWSGFGALAGSWIGGTGNLAAVADGLGTSGEQVGMVVIVDNFVYVLYFPIILTCKRWAERFNRFTRVSQEQIDHIAQTTKEVEKKTHEVHFRDVLTLLGWAFTAILIANLIAGLLPELKPVLTEKTWAMLLVTTFGILLSSTKLKDVPGTEPLAMMFVYIYMTMIGASADLRNFAAVIWFLLAGAICIVIHFAVVIVGARLFRVDVSMAAVASVAAVGGAASAPVAAGYHREELVPVSIMLALLGYALGNYLGVLTAYLCHMIA